MASTVEQALLRRWRAVTKIKQDTASRRVQLRPVVKFTSESRRFEMSAGNELAHKPGKPG
jgi:hypothetical protein